MKTWIKAELEELEVNMTAGGGMRDNPRDNVYISPEDAQKLKDLGVDVEPGEYQGFAKPSAP